MLEETATQVCFWPHAYRNRILFKDNFKPLTGKGK